MASSTCGDALGRVAIGTTNGWAADRQHQPACPALAIGSRTFRPREPGTSGSGAAIASAGLELTPDATGRLIAAVSTNLVMAISVTTTAAAGEWVAVKLVGPYAKP